MIIKGKCLCEAVQYEIQGDLGPIFNCHCSKCRRWHGAVYRTRASINRDQYTILSGEALLSSYKSSENVTKYFCSQCGSPLHSSYLNNPDILGIPVAPLEGVESTPKAHIFVESKASWFEITDFLPQYPQWPETEEAVRKTGE